MTPLQSKFYQALNDNDDATVSELLSTGFDINAAFPGKHTSHATLLTQAISENKLTIIQKLLDLGALHYRKILIGRKILENTPLMIAAHDSSPAVMEMLIRQAPVANYRDLINYFGFSALVFAVYGKKTENLYWLILQGAKSEDLNVALYIAAEIGAIWAVPILLEAGADLWDQYHDEETAYCALEIAASKGHNEIIVQLLPHLPLSDLLLSKEQQRKMLSAMAISAGKGHLSIVQLLSAKISDGAKLNQTMLLAAQAGHRAIVDHCLACSGIDVEATLKHRFDFEPKMPNLFLFAAKHGWLDLFKRLLPRFDINAFDWLGMTPLLHAAASGQANIISFILTLRTGWLNLQYGALLTAINRQQETALMLCAQSNCIEGAKLLLAAIKNPKNYINAKAYDGRSALLLAAENGNIEMMNFLLSHGAQSAVSDDQGNSLLKYAVKSAKLEVVDLVLSLASMASSSLAQGLCTAAETGHSEIFHRLCSSDVDLKAISNNDRNLLFFAASGGNIKIIQTLLLSGVNPDSYDKNAFTPLTIAIRHKNLAAITTLAEASLALNVDNTHGETPLSTLFTNDIYYTYVDPSAKAFTFAAAKTLLKAGANLNYRNRFGLIVPDFTLQKILPATSRYKGYQQTVVEFIIALRTEATILRRMPALCLYQQKQQAKSITKLDSHSATAKSDTAAKP